MNPFLPPSRKPLWRGLLWLWVGAAAALLLLLLGMTRFSQVWATAMVERSPALLYDEALRLHQARQYAAALPRLRAALALDPSRHEAHFLVSACRLALGELEAGDTYADLAIRHCPPGHPQLWRYYYHRGFLEFRLGRRAQAIRDWSISAHHHPANPQVYAQLGQVYAAESDWAEARRMMQEAARLDPDQAEYAFLLGVYYMRENDWTRALTHLEEAVRLDAGNRLAYRHLGYCAMQAARYGDAQHYLEQYLEERGDDEPARIWLRRVRQRLQR